MLSFARTRALFWGRLQYEVYGIYFDTKGISHDVLSCAPHRTWWKAEDAICCAMSNRLVKKMLFPPAPGTLPMTDLVLRPCGRATD